jgi:hypothetical protein
VLVEEVDALGLAVGVVAQEAVARLVEEADEFVDLQLQQRPLEHVARLVDVHVAGGTRHVGRLVVFQPFRAHHRVAAAQLGIAFDHRFLFGAALDAIAFHEGRQLRARGRRDVLAQHRAGAQARRGLRAALRQHCDRLQQRRSDDRHRAQGKAGDGRLVSSVKHRGWGTRAAGGPATLDL